MPNWTIGIVALGLSFLIGIPANAATNPTKAALIQQIKKDRQQLRRDLMLLRQMNGMASQKNASKSSAFPVSSSSVIQTPQITSTPNSGTASNTGSMVKRHHHRRHMARRYFVRRMHHRHHRMQMQKSVNVT